MIFRLTIMRKHKRNKHSGRFVQDRTIYTLFIVPALVIGFSFLGVNTIVNAIKSLDKVFIVENSQAIEIQPTWQDEVKDLIRKAGLDADLASRIIQHESWWQPDNSHRNKDGTLDRGLWMISDYWHPEVSDDCAYDYYCSTTQAIRIIKQRGWNEWIAYKHGHVK